MDYKDIIFTKEEGIATITLNLPDRMNVFTPEMSDSICHAVEDVAQDAGIRVLVITGAGRAFCAGADVKKMAENSRQNANPDNWSELPETHLLISFRLQKLEKPVIASINGTAAGGGLDLACACDIRISSDRAKFVTVFVRRGLIPVLGGAYFLPRLVGLDRACQLIWTGEMIDAKEAERIGLVTMVVPHEELQNATRELAEKLAKGPPLAIQRAKRVIYQGLTTDLKSHLDYIRPIAAELRKTEDHKEGTRAFAEKREPVFKGR